MQHLTTVSVARITYMRINGHQVTEGKLLPSRFSSRWAWCQPHSSAGQCTAGGRGHGWLADLVDWL